MLHIALINSPAIYVISNAKKDVDSFEFEWEFMKALVKPNMHTYLAHQEYESQKIPMTNTVK